MASGNFIPAGGPEPAVIGLDVGASGVRAWRARADAHGRWGLVGPGVERVFPPLAFVPAAVEDQLAQIERGLLKLSAEETRAGVERVRMAGECVRAAAGGATGVVLGIAAAGMKTRDGRGICAARNGPRVPDYLESLTEELAEIQAVALPERLWSDGDCAGFGERAAGELGDVQHGYYLGGGTGLAESLLLEGDVVLLDEGLDWFPKAWQLESETGATFEALLGFESINRTWRKTAGPLAPEHPEIAAAGGDAQATAFLAQLAERLAALLEQRIRAVDERGRVLERIVLGQRFGAWFGAAASEPTTAAELFRTPLEQALAKRLEADARLAFEYLTSGALRDGFLRGSSLRAAPALGAAVRAAATPIQDGSSEAPA